jgi:2-polyprenyl-3-methyl-5-hydroxy-6-metoxy-1,4-benzoquinol methylase
MLMECKECQTMMLDISPSEMESHLRSASYTNPANYDRFLRERVKFFDWLIGKYLGGLPRDGSAKVLDFGTSYGHMTRMLAERGFKVYGWKLTTECASSQKRSPEGQAG